MTDEERHARNRQLMMDAEGQVEQAWRKLDTAHRALPDCEHVRAWKAEIAAAQEVHQKAIRARSQLRSKITKAEKNENT